MDIKQIANSFDPITQNRIIKGAWIAFWNSAVFYGILAVLDYAAGIKVADPNTAAMLAFAIQFGRNSINEWHKGM